MKMSFSDIKDELMETTSSPAFKKMFDSHKSVNLVFWIVILAGTMTGLTMNMMYIISLYQQTPISTEITQTVSGLEDFPTVTICRPFNVLKMSVVQAIVNDPIFKFQNRTLQDFITILYGYTNAMYFSLEKEKYGSMLQAVRRSEWRRIFEYLDINITIQIEDILLSCKFNGLKCDFRHFRRYDDPSYYNCYSFDVATFTRNYSMTVTSDSVGLELLMNTYSGMGDRDETVKAMATDSTFFIEIHAPGTRPSLSENVILDTAPRLIHLDVQRTEFTKMYVSTRPCFRNEIGSQFGYETIRPLTNFRQKDYYDSAFVNRFAKFTRNDCLNDEWQKLIVTKCGCFSPLVPVSRFVLDLVRTVNKPLTWCTDSEMLTEYLKIRNIFSNSTIVDNVITYYFYYVTKNGVVGNMAQELNNTKAAGDIECLSGNTNQKDNLAIVNQRCPSFCFQESYSVDLNLLEWRKTTENTNSLSAFLKKKAREIQNILNNQSDRVPKPILDTDFLFNNVQSLSYMEIVYRLGKKFIITEAETYPLINLCSNIGGVMGLWVGSNILIIAEVLVATKLILSTLVKTPRKEERKKDSLKVTRKEIIQDFVDKTSFNGINHLIASKNCIYRIFWLIILSGAVVGLGIHTTNVMAIYFSKPISIELNYQLDQNEYPAITFCPSTIVSGFFYRDAGYGDMKFNWNHLSNTTLRRLIDGGMRPMWIYLYEWQRRTLNLPIGGNSATRAMLDASVKHSVWGLWRSLEFQAVVRKDAYNMFFSCEFSHQNCSFNDFYQRYHPVHKTCFTYSHSGDNLRLGYPEFVSLLAVSNDIDSSMVYNMSSLTLFRGGLFEVHAQRSMATMLNGHPFAQLSRKIVRISKTVDQIVNSSDYRCTEEGAFITLVEDDINFRSVSDRQSQYVYSPELCQQLKIQDSVIDTCKCLSHMLPTSLEQYLLFMKPNRCGELPITALRDGIRFTTVNDSVFVNQVGLQQYIESLYMGTQFLNEFNCHFQVVTNDTVKSRAVEQCHVPCKKVSYDVRINENASPSFYQAYTMVNVYNRYFSFLKAANTTSNSLFSYYIRTYFQTPTVYNFLTGFHFYFETSETRIVTQRLSYGIVEVFSDFGGVLGLWFGISIATGFELLELVILLIMSKG